ncbi:MAG: hypothetical protein A3E37_03775 [Candidatus Andersenbacteria bacterium RIFCSPHIGHO2_12_FULL_46_9]|nr:MAG: hypothetical protein UW94_C0005G0134 [Parcubacteria group bacterium GW2011_GWA2_45_14]OGY33250.1 MAG: hypothetical protein A3B76_00985 [Candidatus Andersenbacteria bacterium RIFCSPHIGHO2_02_FULL_46_16]OGY38354.1 MAG: hypothetical protein A3E37_03775 [Candidatus Andersenbacteria bacterium RIFCSPHIGHO2_12_FULL_46_9]OGY38423.1 MAG: hypothetical protein A3I08_02630 [Candidatus Andersenbacteria bacterium RIFCSPLOWO2_02_FULL_46_11]OGY41957.1 MAG: hypothetical protein A3G57_04580 [Candidatus A
MNTVSRIVTGVIGIIIGVVLTGVGIIKTPGVFIYAVPVILLALFILFNKKEDEIEEIKYRKD